MPKPALLLHACCAPCASAVIERLCFDYELTLFFYNPNIHGQAEYERRLNELCTFLSKSSGTNLIESPYTPDDFYEATGVLTQIELQTEKERGVRCERCYKLRLKKTQEYACAHGFEYFCTTLTISPHKDAGKINAIGKRISDEANPPPHFLEADFKKKDGYKRSLELSAKYGLYRQTYCGCEYSGHPCS